MNRSKFIAHLRSCLFYQLHACRSARVFKYFVGGFYNSLLGFFLKCDMSYKFQPLPDAN